MEMVDKSESEHAVKEGGPTHLPSEADLLW